ncbi:MAG: flagellar motor switch protein [Rhodobacteraceae bacterium]|nr:flagellar motor switch protein [Paracoccaceae bacterium]
MTAIIVDAIIMCLLAGSLAYGYRVSRKVQVLMQTLKELEPLVEQFSWAVDKSEQSVNTMRASISDAERVEKTLENARRAPEPQPEPRDKQKGLDMPFLRKRAAEPEFPGVKLVQDKNDLVKRFFELTRDPQKA